MDDKIDINFWIDQEVNLIELKCCLEELTGFKIIFLDLLNNYLWSSFDTVFDPSLASLNIEYYVKGEYKIHVELFWNQSWKSKFKSNIEVCKEIAIKFNRNILTSLPSWYPDDMFNNPFLKTLITTNGEIYEVSEITDDLEDDDGIILLENYKRAIIYFNE